MMSDTQHTPTPWRLRHSGKNDEVYLEMKLAEGWVTMGVVLSRVTDTHTQVANAEFICLACNAHDDLLAACEELASCHGHPVFVGSVFFEVARDKARAAIAKAKDIGQDIVQDITGATPDVDED